MASLGLVKEVGGFIDVEIDETSLFMDGVTPEILAEEDMPVGFEVFVKVLFEVLGHLGGVGIGGLLSIRPLLRRC